MKKGRIKKQKDAYKKLIEECGDMKAFFIMTLAVLVSAQAEYELRQYDIKKTSQIDGNPKSRERDIISNQRVIIPSVKAVIISLDRDMPGKYVLQTSKGVQFYRVMQGMQPKKKEAFQKDLEKFIVGQPLTLEKIEAIKSKVSTFYQNNGFALVVVNVPEQDVTDGVLVITVLEARLGKVEVTGNKFFSTDWYLKNLSVEEDQTIQTATVDSDVAYINQSPWRQASAIYKAGSQYGTTDIELYVRDERPARLFMGVDNTGFEVTNYNRIFFGFNLGNFLNYDQNLAFQYTASPDFQKFQAYTVFYSCPLPWRDEISLIGGYSTINVHTVYSDDGVLSSHNHGKDWQASFRYGVFIPPSGKFFQKAKAGLDIKQTNNDLTVSNFAVVSSSLASVVEAVGTYEATYTFKNNTFTFVGEGFVQPWYFGRTMSETNYSELRPGSVTKFFYARLKGEYVWADPASGMSMTIKVRAQGASGALIPLETFGIGGENSVRGYVERVVNVDNGGILNFEFRTPYVSPSRNRISDKFSAVLFCDLGGGGVLRPVSEQPSSYFLAGIGPGLRYDISSVLRTRFDVGFRLTDEPFASSTPERARFYFNVTASY